MDKDFIDKTFCYLCGISLNDLIDKDYDKDHSNSTAK